MPVHASFDSQIDGRGVRVHAPIRSGSCVRSCMVDLIMTGALLRGVSA